MKILLFALLLCVSCSKDKKDRYVCTAGSGGDNYNEISCKDDHSDLSQYDAHGRINWGCTKQ